MYITHLLSKSKAYKIGIDKLHNAQLLHIAQ